MSFKTERFHLRVVSPSDLDSFFKIYGDPATNVFNPAGPYPDIHKARKVLEQWIVHWQERGFGKWAVSLHENPEKIIGFGGLSISRFADLTINNLSYRFTTEAWGKGLATELSVNAIKYGFTELELSEISATVRGGHLASQKVFTKSGLRYVKDT